MSRAADWDAYPSLMAPAVDLPGVVACLLLLTPLVAWRRRT